MRLEYIRIDGKEYAQGTIFVIQGHDGIRPITHRTIFLYHDTDRNYYYFIAPNNPNADAIAVYPDTRFLKHLVALDTPTNDERKLLQQVLQDRQQEEKQTIWSLSNDHKSLLIGIGLLALFAALPPVGLIILLCIVFSDKTTSGFIGCLSPFLILLSIAWIIKLFD